MLKNTPRVRILFTAAGLSLAVFAVGARPLSAVPDREKAKGPWPDGARVLTPQGWADEEPSWSPDGRSIAFRTFQYGRADIFTVDPEGKLRTALLMSQPEDVEVRWLDEGKALAVARTSSSGPRSKSIDDILRLDPASGRSTAFAKDEPAWLAWAVSGDGRTVVAAGFRTQPDRHFFLRRFDARSGEFTEVSLFFPTGMLSLDELALSPDGTRCAILAQNRNRDRDVYVVALAGAEERVLRLTEDGREKKSLLWSPRGSRLLFLGRGDPVSVPAARRTEGRAGRVRAFALAAVSADGRGSVRVLSEEGVSADTPAWHPDGTHIVYAAGLGGRWALAVANAETNKTFPLTGGEWRDFSPSCSPDGRTIVFVSDRAGDRDLFLIPFRGGKP